MKDKKTYLYIIGIILILAIGLGIYYYFSGKDNETINIDKLTEDDAFSVIDDDEEINWDSLKKENINLNNQSVTINEGGVYTLSGSIDNGNVIVNTNGNVKLILDNVTITNNSGPAILVENAKNVVIELVDGTVNTLTDGKTYSNSEYDGCIYSKDDLILQGSGKLVVNANYRDGIVSKDDLKIVSGTYEINANDDAIRGKDSVYIVDGTFVIKASGDGIKSTNDTETDKGNILIDNGNFTITTVNDGIQAESNLIIKGGEYTIKTTGNTSNDSAKGLKAVKSIVITGGVFNLDTTDDAIHTDGDMTINNGNYTIKSGDDGIHADGMITINNGTFSITASEGIEATYVKINDGDINISASDDGINAGRKSKTYDVTIEINGGNITIKMGAGDTDAIDSNGNLYINGGTLNITANSPFDYDGEAKYTGGKMIVNGEETTTITNQFMGGGMMRGGNMPNAQDGNMPQGGPNGEQRGQGGMRGRR